MPYYRGRETLLLHATLSNIGDPLWPLKVRWFDIVAVSVAPATPGIDVLIGQDILSELVLSPDGPRIRLLLMY